MKSLKQAILFCCIHVLACQAMDNGQEPESPAASDCIGDNTTTEIIIPTSKRGSKTLHEEVAKRMSKEYPTQEFETLVRHAFKDNDTINKFLDFFLNELQKYHQTNKLSTPAIDRNYILKKENGKNGLEHILQEKYGSFLNVYWKKTHDENLTTEDIRAVNTTCKDYYDMRTTVDNKQTKQQSLKKLILCPLCWCFDKVVEDQCSDEQE